jgi:hypothetical protein
MELPSSTQPVEEQQAGKKFCVMAESLPSAKTNGPREVSAIGSMPDRRRVSPPAALAADPGVLRACP